MKTRYRLTRRGIRGNKFYCVDKATGKRTSLHTSDEEEARQIVEARNQSERQPVLNLQIAKAYLAGTDNGIANRTWQQAIEALTNTKQGANQQRWQTAAKDKAFAPLLPRIIIETPGELLLKVLQSGTVSTNVFLRRLHNFCVDMNWLPWPLIPKRQWPAVRFKAKRAITLEEHQRIIAAEVNPERKTLYQLCWHLGASQGDIANLKGEDVDWANRTISFLRKKTGVPSWFI
jgi:integrase